MPSKNSRKIYVGNSYYHLYNRGVEKRKIFVDTQDYKVFLKYLKDYLSPRPDRSELRKMFSLKGRTFQGIPHLIKNFSKEVDLIAYCLMPNHFHLLIKQSSEDSITGFMQALLTRYSMYFNEKYDRVGSLFQGKYKAVLVEGENYLLHLSRYIHLNPLELTQALTKAYSSYADYLKLRKTSWLKPDIILSFFENKTLLSLRKANSYKKFVEKYPEDSTKLLGEITLE